VRQGAGSPIIQLSRDLDMIYFKEPNFENGIGYCYSDNFERIVERLSEANGTDDLKYLAYWNDVVDTVNIHVRNRLYNKPAKLEQGETIVFDAPYGEYYTNQEVKIETLEVIEHEIRVPTDKTTFDRTGVWGGSWDKLTVKCYKVNNLIFIPHEESDDKIQKIRTQLQDNCKHYGWNWNAYFLFYEQQFAQFKYNHAITIHKSQGSTYKEVVVNIGNIDTNRIPEEKQKMLYTAVTRSSDLLILNNVK
jgi:hypothetical protein